jgi:hypothetical protein
MGVIMNAKIDEFIDTINNWSDLTNLIEHFSYWNRVGWLFRGVRDPKFELLPTIGREEARAIKNDLESKKSYRIEYSIDDERAIYAMFKQQALPFLDHSPSSELEWLAIAQHYGLRTRLLDWTESLLAAAWFATSPGETDGAIYVTKNIQTLPLDYSGDPFTRMTASVYRPPHISPRMSAQGSVLMVCPNPTQAVSLPFCKKIIIKQEAKFTFRKRLNTCGINKRSLFPDLSGLSEHLTWIYKHNWLTGYRQQDEPFEMETYKSSK